MQVLGVTIDELAACHGRPDVLFIDVEGYECHALRGARNTLASHPDCFVEVHSGEGLEKYGGSESEVASFFPEAVYELSYYIENLHGLRPVSARELPKGERFHLLAIKMGP
jgi:hypothetical protein